MPPSRAPARTRSGRSVKILVVDDEQPVLDAVFYSLKKAGFHLVTALDADQCLDLVRREPPDLVVLDVMLPLLSGFDVCRLIRKQRDLPIIMLIAR